MASKAETEALERTESLEALEEDQDYQPPWWAPLVAGSSRWIGIILFGLVAVFCITEPSNFISLDNARNLANDAAVLLLLAAGETFVIVMAGIDLSCGAILVFAGVLSAKAMAGMGGNSWAVILVGFVVALLSGLLWGLINGILVGKGKISSFVVTLGTFGMAGGIALVITGGVDVDTGIPFKLVTSIGSGRLAGQVPWLVVIAVVATVLFGILLRSTRFGRYTYAVGSNEEAARRSGISVDWHIAKVFALARRSLRPRRIPLAGQVRHDDGCRPQYRQSSGDHRRRYWWHQFVRRRRHHARHLLRRPDPCGHAERVRHCRHPAVLAASCSGSSAHPGRVPRPTPSQIPIRMIHRRVRVLTIRGV